MTIDVATVRAGSPRVLATLVMLLAAACSESGGGDGVPASGGTNGVVGAAGTNADVGAAGAGPAPAGAAGNAGGEIEVGSGTLQPGQAAVDAGAVTRGPGTPWDWAGVVGTGQSLAVGDPGAARGQPEATVRALTQPFGNLKLTTGSLPWPVDPNDAALALVPLVEPIGRLAPNYPSSWPQNISGETPHAAMANQITALARAGGAADYVGVHSEVGENGQCLSFLVKGATPSGLNGRAYEATLIEARAITRLAQAAGKTYGVAAIIVTHGECDAGNTAYAAQLHQLGLDYAADLAQITGQTRAPLMIVSQQNAVNDRSASTLAQWKIGVDFPADAVCSGPKYQYPYSSDSIHMLVDGYEQLGEKYAQVYHERLVLGRAWRPLQPSNVERAGRVVSVRFDVPVPPLVWEESFQAPHQSTPAWSAGRGFELSAGGAALAIESVAIDGDAVRITAAADLPATGVVVGYAMVANATPMAQPFAGTVRWGQLRDSDPFVGSSTQKAQPNFAVAFELPVP
ncbi:MAG: dockerin [Polyangiaceae bacterium]